MDSILSQDRESDLTKAIESVLDLTESEYLEWLASTKRSIGGSDVGALMGLNHYSNPELVWEKVLMLTQPQGDNAHLRRGRLMEPIVVSEYEFVTKRVATTCRKTWSDVKSYLHASPDRIIIGGNVDAVDTVGILEAKCNASHVFAATVNHGVPASYYVQTQHYINVMGLSWGSFAALNAEQWKLAWTDMQRDDETIAAIDWAAEKFWNDHVLTRKRPSPHPFPAKVNIPKFDMRLWTP